MVDGRKAYAFQWSDLTRCVACRHIQVFDAINGCDQEFVSPPLKLVQRRKRRLERACVVLRQGLHNLHQS